MKGKNQTRPTGQTGQTGQTIETFPTHFPAISAIAKDEAWRWTRKQTLPEGLVIAILFCFVHRLTTGKTFEETFCTGDSIATDYQI